MKKIEFVSLCCKLLAIYVVIQMVGVFSIFVQAIVSQSDLYALSPSISIILAIFLALFLWFKSDWIAKKAVSNNNTSNETFSLNATDILQIIIPVIGIFALTDAIPRLLESITQTIIRFYALKGHEFMTMMVPQYIFLCVKLLLGFYLFFGSKKLINIMHLSQNRGTHEDK